MLFSQGSSAWSGSIKQSKWIELKTKNGSKLPTKATKKPVPATPWSVKSYEERTDGDTEKPNTICTVTWPGPTGYIGRFQFKLPRTFVALYVRTWRRSIDLSISFYLKFATGNDHYDSNKNQIWGVRLDSSRIMENAVQKFSRAYNNDGRFSWVFDIVGTTVTNVNIPDALISLEYQIPWTISDNTSPHNIVLGVGVECRSYDNLRTEVGPFRDLDSGSSDDDEFDFTVI